MIAADPSEQFLSAYQSYEDGERLERGGSNQEALKKYHFAESLLQSISSNSPGWQKDVVEYRLKKTREALNRLQDSPSSLTDSPRASSSSANNETADQGGNRGPSITITPPSVSIGAGSNPMGTSSEVRRLKRQLTDLKEQLQQAQDALSSQRTREKDLNSEEWVKKKADFNRELQEAKDQVAALKDQLHQRDSWGNDLKDLQKKLNDAVADKLAMEEQYQAREQKQEAASLLLVHQLQDAQLKLNAGNETKQKYEQLSADVEKQKEAMKQLQANLDHSQQEAKASADKNGELQKQLGEATAKLADLEKQADQLAPLKQRFKEMQGEVENSRKQETSAKDQISALKRDIAQKGSDAAKRESSLQADVVVLEEERAAIAQKAQRLAQDAAEAGKVKGLEEESASLKRTVADLLSKLEAADKEASMSKATAEAALQEFKKEKNDLKKTTDSLAADRDVLEKERDDLKVKLAQANQSITDLGKKASGVTDLSKQVEDLKSKLADNAKELDGAKVSLDNAKKASDKQLEDARQSDLAAQNLKAMLEQQNASLQEQLKGALGRTASMMEHGQEAGQLQDQIKTLQEQIDKNTKSYAEAQNKLVQISNEKPALDKALQEKEQMLADAKVEAEKLRSDLSAANQKITDLQKQNSSQGNDRLRQLQDQLAELSKNSAEKEKALADLQKDEAALRDELKASQQKVAALQDKDGSSTKQLKDLQDQLSAKETELALLRKKKGKVLAAEKSAEENTLLRGIVLREVKEEAKKAQARRLMDEEMKHLNIQSQKLTEQITVLSLPTVQLTPEERALFKEGQLEVIDGSPEKMEASISVPISGASQDVSNSTTNQATQDATAQPSPAGTPVSPPSQEHSVAKNHPADDFPWQGKLKSSQAKAKEAFDKQDFVSAESSFKEALALAPDDYFTLSNLGVVEFQLGKMAEAEELLKKATGKSSKSSFALTTLGIVHYRQGRLPDAEKVLRQAISINPEDFTAHNYLGIVLAASGNPKAGESEIMKSLEINQQYADAHFNLAVIYATGKPPAKMMAKMHYTKAVELGAPPDPSLERLVQ